MGRPRNPFSIRNRNATFTGDEVRRIVEKLGASKRAKVVRERGDFDVRELQSIVRAPFIPQAAYSWSIADIVEARDQQLTGRFRLPARLAESMGTDDALFTARGVRLAPVQALSVKIKPGVGGKGDKIADEATALFGDEGIAISSETITTIRSHLVDHGVAFGAITWRAREDGSRFDPQLMAWPIEFVFWHAVQGCYYTQVRRFAEEPPDPPTGGLYMPSIATGFMPLEPIIHGNGRWIVFSKSELLPHRLDAALLPAALVWARHAFAMRDWSKGSSAHGNPKVIGELPPDTPLTDKEGTLTAEAAAFLELVQNVASQEYPVGIRPAGAKMDYLVNTSRAWEVWDELAAAAEKAAARIYLGTDGILGAQGGAPGVDVSQLLGVATSKIESDIACIERGLQTGLVNPWTAINFGDDRSAPTRKYVFPDADNSRVRADFADRNAKFLAAVKAARDAGLKPTQEWVDECAKSYGVPSVPLADLPPPANGDVAPSNGAPSTDTTPSTPATPAAPAAA